MTLITNEFMQEMLARTRTYSVILLRPGPAFQQAEARQIIWEHGRRNFSLRAAGLLSIVCPFPGNNEINGMGIFNASLEETRKIMDEDPAVQAGVLVYDIHSCLGFPGDSLPEAPLEQSVEDNT